MADEEIEDPVWSWRTNEPTFDSDRVIERRLADFNGGYGRHGKISILTPIGSIPKATICDVCKAEDIPVLTFDASEEEYAIPAICRRCCEEAFASPHLGVLVPPVLFPSA